MRLTGGGPSSGYGSLYFRGGPTIETGLSGLRGGNEGIDTAPMVTSSLLTGYGMGVLGGKGGGGPVGGGPAGPE